jgi:hypothetical protein
MTRHLLAAWACALMLAVPVARACSLCSGGFNKQTLRQEAAQAKLVVYGTLSNPRLNAVNPAGVATGAATDLHVEQILKAHPILTGRKVITLSRWLPVNPEAPPKFLVFCDIVNGQLDPYQGSPVKSPAVVEYLRGAMALAAADRAKQLEYFARFLGHADVDVATDAFLEFAKSTDAEVARAARQLEPASLRRLVADPQTPPERLSLFAYMLGACGRFADAELLGELLRRPDDRVRTSFGGILAGYVLLRPAEGWSLVRSILADPKRPFQERSGAVATLRFFQASHPETRPQVLKGLALILPQGDMADLAVEDLRRWQWWDLTTEVLAQFDRKSHESPLVRRSIVRYALSCPRPEATQFIAAVRQREPEMVKDVEESLAFERPAGDPGK